MPSNFELCVIGGVALLAVAATTLEQHGWFEDNNVDMAMTSDVVTSSASVSHSVVALLPMQERASDIEPNYAFALREPGRTGEIVWIV